MSTQQVAFAIFSAAALLMASCSKSEAPSVEPADTAEHGADTGTGWLLGTWQLAYDPDNNPTDYVVFQAGDVVESRESPNGTGIAGKYKLAGDTLKVSFVVRRDREISLDFKVSKDKTRLTKNDGAYYMRR